MHTNQSDTISLSSLSYSNSVVNGGYISSPHLTGSVSASSYPYTVTGAGTGSPYITTGTGISNPWVTGLNSKICLDGEGADIEVNGESLIGMIRKIEERLNILHPNAELEAEWEELKALGEQYRRLEQHIKDKQATWDRLKAMPPPVVE